MQITSKDYHMYADDTTIKCGRERANCLLSPQASETQLGDSPCKCNMGGWAGGVGWGGVDIITNERREKRAK